ncbi:lachesin-like isoform X1 [Vespula squamosa]|uniref:Lachesin-like isoform X1 n=1 Tax=Vespula squamosa TaxID=30214 RepID=A0ABD2ATS2_VESSQ
MRKGPNLFSGRASTPPPAKRPTTVWPSSYNPYSPKRTERPSPPSEERVDRPEQKLRGGYSTGSLGLGVGSIPTLSKIRKLSKCQHNGSIDLSEVIRVINIKFY